MPDPDIYRQLAGFINTEVPFAQHCGIEVTALEESGATATLPDEGHLLNHVGTQHAGALFTAAESASGACMLGLVGDRFRSITPLIRSARMSYRRPAKGSIRITAHSDITRQRVYEALDEEGRCDFAVNVQLFDQAGLVVATAEMAWHVRARGSASGTR